MRYFYENNPAIDSEFNITFEEVLLMSSKEFEEWILKVRAYIKLIWDTKGVPPIIGGSTEKEIVDSFKKLQTFLTDDFLVNDESDNTRTVIKNWDRTASAVNQFFPGMMKTRIAVGESDSGKSIYDWVADKSLEKRFVNTMISKFKKDAMYYFGRNVLVDDPEYMFVNSQSGREWISQYYMDGADKFRRQYDFWIKESDKDRNPKEDKPYLLLTINDIHELKTQNKLTRVNMANLPDTLTPYYKSGKPKFYSIVAFKRDQRVMRQIIQVFRIGFSIQPAVNFPPLTAKFLYEHYIRHIPDENIIVYDPSAGWGGRILGAMAFDKKNVHYVGTDPNTENFIPELGITRYEYLANFFNEQSSATANAIHKFWGHKNTYEVFMDGSEVIRNNPAFQKYKGKLDFVFTSPPYFNREKYSDDETQSCNKYTEYKDWKENFLRPTLTTAYEYLKSNRYICWNIADIKVGKNEYIPLEQDSIDILKGLGAEYVTKLKMIVVTMIGLDASKLKNKCKVDGRWQKYEPVYVFRKIV